MTIKNIKITILVDNKAHRRLTAEHGFSAWIEAGEHRILFDTGQGPALVDNTERLGIPLEQTRSLVLSHGHYDHTGGVGHVLRCAPTVEAYCHPGAVRPRYVIRQDFSRAAHMPKEARAALDKLPSQRMHWIWRPQQLTEDIGLTGPIPRASALEDTGGPFFLDAPGTRPDAITDDTALWINTPKGAVVCVGCCHAGLVNTLNHVRYLNGVSEIRAVIGGFHLLQASPQRLQWTLSSLKALSPTEIVPCHCTGEKAVAALEAHFDGRVRRGYAGMQLTF
jgi:7,8-dihydropterin-6-yl-methyl-4-(beta-D-ribofuranosyl)aminobenzene 5'-phosphate synthase